VGKDSLAHNWRQNDEELNVHGIHLHRDCTQGVLGTIVSGFNFESLWESTNTGRGLAPGLTSEEAVDMAFVRQDISRESRNPRNESENGDAVDDGK
jgi:hypothetical protein